MKRRLSKLKATLLERKGQLFRNQVAPHRDFEEYGLRGYQVYPEGGNLDIDFFTQPSEHYPKLIDRTTPIASMGSCFNVEIKNHLRKAKFNFLDTRESAAATADWERVYTTKNMLQTLQYSFTEFLPDIRFGKTAKGYFDPYREGPLYASEEAAAIGQLEHREKMRNAFASCKVLILTPGLNEAWINKNDGLAWSLRPTPEVLATYGEERFCFQSFSLSENIGYLDSTLSLLWANNPEAQVIFTVSPVPCHSTYFDTNVAVQNIENKAIILLAVKEILRQYPERTFYYPGFEMAMLSHNWNLQLDNRHLRPKVVERVLACFDRRFVVDD